MDAYQNFLPYLKPFYQLQYPTATPTRPDSFHDSPYYNVGRLDICMLISCMAVMAILRDALRLGFFEPLARWKLHRDLRRKREQKALASSNGNGKSKGGTNGHAANGVEHTNGNGHANGSALPPPTTKELRQLNRSVMRFAEQGWSVVYYPLQWCFGLYVHLNLPTKVLDPVDLWREYPHIPLAAPIKLYYLAQTAFYIHQILVLNAEARRKDHAQMMAHHIITVTLMLTSYFTNFTRVGCLIMLLMDWCDIFFPLAKMIRYLDISQLLCDLTFAWFMVSWLVTRQFLFLFVIYSTIFEAPPYIEFKWDWDASYYVTRTAFNTFCVLLVLLQGLQIIWFGMICRVAWRVVRGKGAADERSDTEGESEDPAKDD